MKCEDSIGFHFREVNHLMERCLYLRHLKGGADKITASHGWMISYLYHNMDMKFIRNHGNRISHGQVYGYIYIAGDGAQRLYYPGGEGL